MIRSNASALHFMWLLMPLYTILNGTTVHSNYPITHNIYHILHYPKQNIFYRAIIIGARVFGFLIFHPNKKRASSQWGKRPCAKCGSVFCLWLNKSLHVYKAGVRTPPCHPSNSNGPLIRPSLVCARVFFTLQLTFPPIYSPSLWVCPLLLPAPWYPRRQNLCKTNQ